MGIAISLLLALSARNSDIRDLAANDFPNRVGPGWSITGVTCKRFNGKELVEWRLSNSDMNVLTETYELKDEQTAVSAPGQVSVRGPVQAVMPWQMSHRPSFGGRIIGVWSAAGTINRMTGLAAVKGHRIVFVYDSHLKSERESAHPERLDAIARALLDCKALDSNRIPGLKMFFQPVKPFGQREATMTSASLQDDAKGSSLRFEWSLKGGPAQYVSIRRWKSREEAAKDMVKSKTRMPGVAKDWVEIHGIGDSAASNRGAIIARSGAVTLYVNIQNVDAKYLNGLLKLFQ